MAASNRLLALSLLGAVALTGCEDTERAFAGFDGPGDVVLLEPGEFYEVPVAFVASLRNGRVSKLDLKRTMLLVEDGPAPWMQAPDLSFGADRVLSEIALAERPGELDVWVADDTRDEVLMAPYLRLDGDSRDWTRPAITDGPRFIDVTGVDESGILPELRSLRVRAARATTETWTLTWKGTWYEVRGTASGLQRNRAVPGVRYVSDRDELAFVPALNGATPDLGDTISFDVDNGVVAIEAGGLVMDLRASLDGTWVFAAVLPSDADGFLAVYDAVTVTEIDRLPLPTGATPERLALGATDGVLWIADSADTGLGGQVHRLDYVPGDVDSLAITTIAVPEPAIDVAEGRDPDAARLFVAAAFTDAVWMLDGVTYELIDINPWTEVVDPMELAGGTLATGSPISGLAATPGPARTWQMDERGIRNTAYGVVATTFAGEMYWLDAESGCIVHDLPASAFLDVPAGSEGDTFRDVGQGSNPQLTLDAVSDTVVTTNTCGGIARNEVWTFRYSELLQAYEVEGSRSGEQDGLCYEGERYVTDGGELSVLIQPGTQATTEGDAWAFPINDAITPIGVQQMPGDPAVFTERYDDRSGEWWKLRERQVVIVPHVANDIVLWVDLEGHSNGLRVYQ